jgi:ubiquinone/menaquinone biosynthesis C-methylase UbiE
MTHPHDRFTGTVETYAKHRPSYPAALVDWVLEQAALAGGDLVIDVGCGTGISSRLFAARDLRVLGVDPNGEMLAAARQAGGAIEYLAGAAEHLPVADNIAHGAISGQAFHWLDLDRALPELNRVLRPGRICVAFWNAREQSTPFLKDYEQLLCTHCREYPVASAEATIERIRGHRYVARVREQQFAHGQRFNREELAGRAWSSSYVVHSVQDADAFNRELAALFERHQTDGHVEFRYTTLAIAFQPGPPTGA